MKFGAVIVLVLCSNAFSSGQLDRRSGHHKRPHCKENVVRKSCNKSKRVCKRKMRVNWANLDEIFDEAMRSTIRISNSKPVEAFAKYWVRIMTGQSTISRLPKRIIFRPQGNSRIKRKYLERTSYQKYFAEIRPLAFNVLQWAKRHKVSYNQFESRFLDELNLYLMQYLEEDLALIDVHDFESEYEYESYCTFVKKIRRVWVEGCS